MKELEEKLQRLVAKKKASSQLVKDLKKSEQYVIIKQIYVTRWELRINLGGYYSEYYKEGKACRYEKNSTT